MYIVVELQKNGNTVENLVTAHATQLAAESHYHSVLAAAAISGVECHSAILMSDEAFPLRHECYKDKPQVASPVEEA